MERLEKTIVSFAILIAVSGLLYYVGLIGYSISENKYIPIEKENIVLKNKVNSLEESIKENKKHYYEKGVKSVLDTAAEGNHGVWALDPLSGKIQFQWYKIRIISNPVVPMEEIPPAVNLPNEGKND